MKRLQGYNVLSNRVMTLSGFPLRTMPYTGQHPRIVTDTNIEKFEQQMKAIDNFNR